jgi:hypothetical protein
VSAAEQTSGPVRATITRSSGNAPLSPLAAVTSSVSCVAARPQHQGLLPAQLIFGTVPLVLYFRAHSRECGRCVPQGTHIKKIIARFAKALLSAYLVLFAPSRRGGTVGTR